jgi:asparagine synthase (glutamine-hydrolysing)
VAERNDLHVMENGSILSHERLSIIDLHSGKTTYSKRYYTALVHNGEVYNHQELREVY